MTIAQQIAHDFLASVNYLSHAVQKFLWKWLLTVVTITHL